MRFTSIDVACGFLCVFVRARPCAYSRQNRRECAHRRGPIHPAQPKNENIHFNMQCHVVCAPRRDGGRSSSRSWFTVIAIHSTLSDFDKCHTSLTDLDNNFHRRVSTFLWASRSRVAARLTQVRWSVACLLSVSLVVFIWLDACNKSYGARSSDMFSGKKINKWK